ncbi:MAG: flagellar motor switch protein FliG [Dehalobacter sp. 4CP]|jgi:flagellar motor switch protein FliG|uniref:flagellar motor switch protein FliG n=1 Tax=unclassified Dehalobacter TaxID=2635733 RepID=UPI00028A823A|nr:MULTISPECIES: flagellar motor switch protein FliG [unclassified Dehalobacter]MCM1565395.1 flagellar motor switch protein FliG [Dehalobacter sp.]NBJ15368.1 flagellar motor switch protein FliG [Dehalobacter sp. 4CP]AFV02563.1 Flagellar motor switch protein FliG [Dehalobacter sp. DCA]AFV05551.1 Flagellar motor switch protein FliG [Dehalobacter sp. CF]EQB19799.1 Flagellar motor switch protein FliG [Dehalobacter sp. UNSWDHB]
MSSGIFTGLQKAAVLLITLGPERSSEIIKFLSEPEIEQLTLEMSNMRKVSEEQRDSVIDEFHKMCLASNYIAQGGIEYARDVLERALGQQRAFDIIGRLSSSLKMRPFDIVRRTDPKQLFSFIQGEHPQTISLIMTHLPPDKAATILASLPQDLQAEVTKRIALMGRTSPEVLKEIEKVLENKISNLAPTDYTSSGGMQSVVDMLNRADPGTLKTVMDVLEMDDPDLAEQIKRQMFVFDDVILLDDRSVQLVLREVETKDLALALKGSNEDVTQKILTNMSSRSAGMLKEDMQFMGPVRLREVEEAQQKIVKVIRKLEEAGAIVISRGGADEIIY